MFKFRETRSRVQENFKSKKLRIESAIAGTTIILFPIGAAIIGTINITNAILEVKDTRQGRPGSSFTRAALYGLAGLYEYGLEIVGATKVGSLEGEVLRNHLGQTFLPEALHPLLGLASVAAIGACTGFLTNTVVWETRRKR